ncbi:MAG TPA: hypothetical protein VK816_10830 [Jatrophihabitantaceae bacterium]|nr:hypothetical protein [Jatrophihabitantaceae bacterium]
MCTGNVCRSPMAERLLLARVAPAIDVTSRSAGLSPLEGFPVDPRSAAAVRELGADPEDHLARRLTVQMIRESELILTAEHTHRGAVMRVEPMAMTRTFTLREFGWLAQSLPPAEYGGDPPTTAELSKRVAQVARQRGTLPPHDQSEDDIADPHRGTDAQMTTCAQQVARSVDAVIAALGIGR